MSDQEAQEQTPSEAVAAALNPAPADAAESAPERPKGWEQIDYEGLKRAGVSNAQIQVIINRTNRLYGQVKAGERLTAQMSKDLTAALGRLEALEESGRTRETKEIRAELASAAERGDATALADLTTRLATTISSKSKGESTPKTPEARVEQPAASPQDLSELVTPEQEAALVEWAQERGPDRQPLRPWIDQSHPLHKRANAALAGLLADQALVAQGAPAVMSELDSIMGVAARKRQSPQAAVLQSDSGVAGTAPKGARLNPQQREAAKVMGITEERYAKALASQPKLEGGRVLNRAEFE